MPGKIFINYRRGDDAGFTQCFIFASRSNSLPKTSLWMSKATSNPARGALVNVLDKPHLDLTTPIGRGFIAFLSALAEDERQRIVKRANDGRKAARARGARFGRRPKLNEHQRKEATRRLVAGE